MMNLTQKPICLTGVKPTGVPHLGNMLGAIRPAIEFGLSGDYDSFLFIADYHALISMHDAKLLRQYNYEVAATWLALGLDPNRMAIYRQSDIPEILELHWILSCFTIKGLMNRAHAYKASVDHNIELGRDGDHGVNIGLYTYPVLMSADILMLNSHVVPVGADQVQHIEIARDIASHFNHVYGEIFRLPKAIVQKDSRLVPGLDGRKMSKSYQNHMPLFMSSKDIKKHINKIVTDSSDPTTPKNPDESIIFDLFTFFATAEEIQNLRDHYSRGIGWGEAKAQLQNVIERELKIPTEIYRDYIEHPKKIEDVLQLGKEKTRPLARKFLDEIKNKIGL